MRRLLLFFCLFARLASAQPPPTFFLKQFGPAEGLQQPFIYALAQDAAGYLWLGTAEGLIRFDGTEFVTFTTQDGLAEDFVTRLYVQPGTGQLWVGHYQGRLSKQVGSRFASVSPDAGHPQGFAPRSGLPPSDTLLARSGAADPRFRPRPLRQVLPAGTIPRCVLTDREHNLWVGTAGQGLWRWSDRHVTFYPMPSTPEALDIRALASGPQAFAGLSTGHWGQLRDEPAHLSPVAEFETPLLPYAPSLLRLTPAPPARPGNAAPNAPALRRVWAGTAGHGLWRGLVRDSLLKAMRRVGRLPDSLTITALAQHPGGDLWVGTSLHGIYRLPADSTQPAEHFTTTNGLLHNTIYALTADSAGQVWVGTHGTGLAVWRRGRFRYYRFRKSGLDVSALLTDERGRVWVGTEGNGVFCYERGRFAHFDASAGLLSPYCYALLPVRWGRSQQPNARPQQLLVVHRNGISLADRRRFRPATLPANLLVRGLLPDAAIAADAFRVWLRTRAGLLCLRTDDPALLPTTQAPTPRLLAAEIDGAPQPPYQLGELSATRHQVSFRFQAVSLRPGTSDLRYQYRLRGYQNEWSEPVTLSEARFPRLESGKFVFEVRARVGALGTWSKPAATTFTVATPYWQTGWFALLSVATITGSIWGFMRVRTAALRRQKLQLETTVRERTTELRQQKTAIEQINADLVVARDAAEASRRAKSQFLANMSHEIRTPMNAVIGLSHLLRNTPVNDEQQEYLEAIQSSSQNLLVIINDILDSSKMEAGKLSLEHAPLRLPELMERVARMFQFATAAKGLYLRTEIGPEVPAAILGDPVRLNQILVNLVGNAVKFTTRGGVTLRLHVVAAQPAAGGPDSWLRFGVRDTGIGIAADKLDTIFEEFSPGQYQHHPPVWGHRSGAEHCPQPSAAAQRPVVGRKSGRPGRYLLVRDSLPAHRPGHYPSRNNHVSLTPFEPPLRVLVAEDNELNQLVVRKTLEAWNVRVTLAANGRLAVEAARRQSFDAVLLDVQMPEMDGYEAARQLRALFPDPARLPLIGLTASALPEDRALALEAGMNDSLAKPFDPALLYARLAHFTGRASGPARAHPPSPPVLAPLPQGPNAPTELPDWTLLEELAGGNEEFVCQIVRTFLAQAPELAEQLQLPAGPALGQVAHKLKGQVAYFGLPTLTQLLETVEQTAQITPPDPALPKLLAAIQQRLRALYPVLEHRQA